MIYNHITGGANDKTRQTRRDKKDRGLYTVAVPKEIYDQLSELSVGSNRPLSAIATLLITKGLSEVQIIEETITRKRIVFDD